jgi:hypothetical protein
MVHQFRQPFPHRFNADGSYDSICTVCQMKVASAKIEVELSQHERDHACDPVRMHQRREAPFARRQHVRRHSAISGHSFLVAYFLP